MTTETLAAPIATTSEQVEVQTSPEAAAVIAEAKVEAPKSFLDSLPEDLKGNKSLEKFKDVSDIAKSYVNLESLIGKKITEMPDEVVKQYLKVPTAPEKYILPEDAKDVITEDFLKLGLKNNINQAQMKEIADALVIKARQEKEIAEVKANEMIEANKKELEKEFGISLDKRMDAVKSVLSQYGDENLNETLKQSGLLHDAKFIKFLDKITQDALSAKLVGEDYARAKFLTPNEAKQKVAEKMQDTNFRSAYYSANHPGHKQAVDEMRKLFASMNS
jgi:hypothetical protein